MKIVTVSKTQLKADYENLSTKEICEKYGICYYRLYKMLDDCGIEHKRAKRRQRHEIKIVYGV